MPGSQSARGDETPADTQEVTPIHISDTNAANDSPGAAQTNTATEQIQRAIAVAKALEQAADVSPETLKHARQIAVEIQAEAAQPQPNPGRLQHLLAELVHLAS